MKQAFLTTLFLATAQSAAANPLFSDDSTRNLMLFGACLVLLLAVALMMKRLNKFQSKLRTQKDRLVNEQDQRVRAEALLKHARNNVEQQVKERTQELEKDNEDLLASTSRMKQLVAYDEVTELPNSDQCVAMLSDELKRALRENKTVSVLVANVDFFDNYLEHYGPDRADSALVKISNAMQKIFRRAGDFVARLGDQEFAAVFYGDSPSSLRFADRLQHEVWQLPIPHDASEIADRVTLSIGVTTLPPTKLHTAQEALKLAKKGVKVAQKQGGNQVEQKLPVTSEAKLDKSAV